MAASIISALVIGALLELVTQVVIANAGLWVTYPPGALTATVFAFVVPLGFALGRR